jgi:hypothetical protein
MIKINIAQYESIVENIIDNLNLREYDDDYSHDHFESIDMIHVDNIESLYDAINDVIETLRINRYIHLNYENDEFVSFEYDDEIRIIRVDSNYENVHVVETLNVDMHEIDEFETQRNL